MVKEIGTNLRQYMDNVPIESENPFYINYYYTAEGNQNDYWSEGENAIKLKEGYGVTFSNDDPDYFVIAVKQGFEVQIALRSNSRVYFGGFDFEEGYERVVIGGDDFLRFTITGGGFLEISGGLDQWPQSDLYAKDFSKLEEQMPNDSAKRALENDLPDERVRWSRNGQVIYGLKSIGTMNPLNPSLTVILDGVTVPTFDVNDPSQPTEEQVNFVPEGEEAVTREDIGTWELIHDEYGHKWEIVELNSPTENNTWAFYFDGVLQSAFADKDKALIALNLHYEKTVSYIKSRAPAEVEIFTDFEQIFYGFLVLMVTRFMGALL
tara:strand:- start:1588 stop:2553 length:966 start_codon:yes stop_codon:yes gene_type:complete